MAKNREGSIDLFGPVQAKTEDGIVAHADGIAVEYDENDKPSKTLDELIDEIHTALEENSGGSSTEGDSFVTVNKLPEIIVQLPGTPTPTGESVYIENLYFNTNLSVEEVTNIILNYCEENNLYTQYGTASIGYINGSSSEKTINIEIKSSGGICIRDGRGPSYYIYWCNEEYANSNMGSWNITRVGWQDFANPLVIDENINAPYKPMELFSTTPSGEGFNPAIKEEKLYRLVHKEEPKWMGTPIPNTGKENGFYFNISLSVEEVEKIINTLDFSNGAEYQVMWFNTGMTSDDIKIEKYEDGAMRITAASSSNTYWCNQKYKDNYDTNNYIQNIGWGAGSSSWNDEGYVRLSYEFYSTRYGNPVGDQNDKLSELLSITPFEYTEGKEELDGYYRFKNNKWIKVLEENDTVIVSELPTENIDETKIYKITSTEQGQLIGGTPLELSDGGDRVYIQINKDTNIYLNTKLTVEEVVSLCQSNITSRGSYSPIYIIAYQTGSSFYYFCGITVCENIETSGTDYVIYYEPNTNGEYVENTTILFTSNASGKYSFTGWNPDITYPIVLHPLSQGSYCALTGTSKGCIKDPVGFINTLVMYTDPLYYSEGKTNIDYFRHKNNKWFKVLDEPDIVDVKQLPVGNGTVVPNTGFVGKVYVNTSLSDEEVEALIDKLCHVNEENNWSDAYILAYDTDSIYIELYLYSGYCYDEDDNFIGIGKGIYYYTEHHDANENTWRIDAEGDLWCNDTVAECYGLQKGWQDFANPIEINKEVQDRWDENDEEPTLGIYNDQLTDLVSITPFTPTGNVNKIYRVPPKSVENIPVPSNGHVGKVYFNTSLSVEEVNEILNGLDYVMGVLSAPAVAIATNTDMSKGLVIMAYPSDEDYVIMTGEGTLVYIYSLIDNDTRGWLLPEVDLNLDNMLEVIASQVGMNIQNEKLKNLISITPFEEPKEEPEYFRKKGDKWIKVLEDTPIVDIDELPPAKVEAGIEWKGTFVPNNTLVETLYFNTELSVKEVEDILKKIPSEFSESGGESYLYRFLTVDTYSKSINIFYFPELNGVPNVYAIMNLDLSKTFWMSIDDGDIPAGWRTSTFNNPYEIKEIAVHVTNDRNTLPSGNYNHFLASLISITPFEQEFVKVPNKDIELDKLYRVPIKIGKAWRGTEVPNINSDNNYVEQLYLNTNLNIQEVIDILKTIEYTPIPNSGEDGTYSVWGKSSSADGIRILYFSGPYIITNWDMSVIYWSSVATESIPAGWQTFDNPILVNSNIRTDEENIGIQNHLLTSLFSTTPFVAYEIKDGTNIVGYKYNQLVNGEWKELGSGGNSSDSTLIIEKTIDDSMGVTITVEEYDLMCTTQSVLLIINHPQVGTYYFRKQIVFSDSTDIGPCIGFKGMYLGYETTIALLKKDGQVTYHIDIISHVTDFELSIQDDYWVQNEKALRLNFKIDKEPASQDVPINTTITSQSTHEALVTPKAVYDFVNETVESNIIVEELPSATLNATHTGVPTSGLIEKVYFNTQLSNETIGSIVTHLTYQRLPNSNYYPLVAVITNSDMSNGLTVMKAADNYYLISALVNGETVRVLDFYEGVAYWHYSELEINYENMLSVLAPQVGITIQNDNVFQLISITPFHVLDPSIKLDKTYSVPIKEDGKVIGYRRYQCINGEWKELLNNGHIDQSVIVITKFLGDHDILSSQFHITDDEWEIMYNKPCMLHLIGMAGGNVLLLKEMILDTSVIFRATLLFGITIEIEKTDDGYIITQDSGSTITHINTFGISGDALRLEYLVNADVPKAIEVPVDTETATDSNSLITSKAVRNYIAEYMSANYDNYDEEEF